MTFGKLQKHGDNIYPDWINMEDRIIQYLALTVNSRI